MVSGSCRIAHPSLSSLPSDNCSYVHGGAWRDPAQTSSCILPALRHITNASTVSKIAGVASLNYRLSPYPSHPTNPSTPGDPSRNSKHPEHVRDIERALNYLEQEYGVGKKERGYEWIGVGHSCGATLLLQYVSGIGLESPHWSNKEEKEGPTSLVLMEGIYDIPRFLYNHEPPHCSPEVAQIYRDIIEGAFGPDTSIMGGDGIQRSRYEVVSPTSGMYKSKGKYTILAHSPEDELVEPEQKDAILKRLRECGWTQVTHHLASNAIVQVRTLSGKHDFIWEDGAQVAELIAQAIEWVITTGKRLSQVELSI